MREDLHDLHEIQLLQQLVEELLLRRVRDVQDISCHGAKLMQAKRLRMHVVFANFSSRNDNGADRHEQVQH